jgi:tetratricopeptide (TPR) repeat protein
VSRSAETPGAAGAAQQRGVAHLKRAEYRQAVEAFTEAIRLDPEAPNGYVGRGLAYRSLGDDAAAHRDEETARALGGPERSAWDRLVKRAYRRWRGDLRDPAWGLEDPLCRDAFLLHQWTWQIYNGGLPQWVANGYGVWAEELAGVAERVGTDAARAVAAVVRDVAGILARWPDAREAMLGMIAAPSVVTGREEELFGELSQCEEEYHRVGHYRAGPSFAADVEEWLEKRAREAS